MADNSGIFFADEERLALCGPLCDKDKMCARRFYRLDDSFSGFAGHFPDYAVLPALAQISFTRILAEKYLGRRLFCRGIRNAKFMRQGRSGDFLCIDVTLGFRDDLVELDGTVSRLAEPDQEPLGAPESAWERISRIRLTCVMEYTCVMEENADARRAL